MFKAGDVKEVRKHECWPMQMSGPFMSSMLPQLVIATVMVFATMMILLVGVTTQARLLRFDPRAEEHHHQFTPRVAWLVVAIVLCSRVRARH